MKVTPREAQARATNSKSIRQWRESLKLSAFQKSVLIGSLLGDGCLVANSWKKNYRLKFHHGAKQERLVRWKHDILQNFMFSEKPRWYGKTSSWICRTISHPEFTQYHQIFYPEGKKIVPNNIERYLVDPVALAVWYMDDGAVKKSEGSFFLHTQSFSRRENKLLQKCLQKNFGVEASIVKNKTYDILYIRKRSSNDFFKAVERYATDLTSEKCPVAP